MDLTLLGALCWITADGSQKCSPAQENNNKNASSGEMLRVCYYTTWARYRPEPANMKPSDMDPFLCSHIVLAFAWISEDGMLTLQTEWADKHVVFGLLGLKEINPNLKILAAVGGWNFGSEPFQKVIQNENTRETFTSSVIPFLKKWELDGLDLDWEYPTEVDKDNYTALIKELHGAFQLESLETGKMPYLLTAAVPAALRNMAGFDIPVVQKYFDFVSVMTYDFYGPWDNQTGHNAPLFSASSNFSLATGIKLWLDRGMPSEKIVVGLASYGHCFNLLDDTETHVGAESLGGFPGKYTRTEGFISYYEVCDFLSKPGTTLTWDREAMVPYAFNKNEWISFDNLESLRIKVRWAASNNFAGVMLWSVAMDDFNGRLCYYSDRTPFPILWMINDEINAVASVGSKDGVNMTAVEKKKSVSESFRSDPDGPNIRRQPDRKPKESEDDVGVDGSGEEDDSPSITVTTTEQTTETTSDTGYQSALVIKRITAADAKASSTDITPPVPNDDTGSHLIPKDPSIAPPLKRTEGLMSSQTDFRKTTPPMKQAFGVNPQPFQPSLSNINLNGALGFNPVPAITNDFLWWTPTPTANSVTSSYTATFGHSGSITVTPPKTPDGKDSSWPSVLTVDKLDTTLFPLEPSQAFVRTSQTLTTTNTPQLNVHTRPSTLGITSPNSNRQSGTTPPARGHTVTKHTTDISATPTANPTQHNPDLWLWGTTAKSTQNQKIKTNPSIFATTKSSNHHLPQTTDGATSFLWSTTGAALGSVTELTKTIDSFWGNAPASTMIILEDKIATTPAVISTPKWKISKPKKHSAVIPFVLTAPELATTTWKPSTSKSSIFSAGWYTEKIPQEFLEISSTAKPSKVVPFWEKTTSSSWRLRPTLFSTIQSIPNRIHTLPKHLKTTQGPINSQAPYVFHHTWAPLFQTTEKPNTSFTNDPSHVTEVPPVISRPIDKRKSSGRCNFNKPIKKDCHNFIQCVLGLEYEMPCPPGTVFNQDKGQCDWPSRVPDCQTSFS